MSEIMMDQTSPGPAEVVVSIENAFRGVIYGRITGVVQFGLELSANGLSLGLVSITRVAANGESFFKLKMPTDMRLEAPATIRGRFVGLDCEIPSSLILRTQEEVAEALTVADGHVSVTAGFLVGALTNINPDALPLTICASMRGRVIARTKLNAEPNRKYDIDNTENRLIEAMPFKLGLPLDVLDDRGAVISVGIEGSATQLTGAPVFISIAFGEDFARRLMLVEEQLEAVTAKVNSEQNSIVSGLIDQYLRVIVPRVDAIVGLQRTALERQMMALWRAMPVNHFEAIAPAYERQAHFRSGMPFIGYGWTETNRVRWFGRQAFVAFEISPEEDVIFLVEGVGAASPKAVEDCLFSVENKNLEMVRFQDSAGGSWSAVGLVPRQFITSDGLLSLRIRSEVDQLTKEGKPPNGLSLGIENISVFSTSIVREWYASNNDLTYCLAGFHHLEKAASGEPFRWMGGDGVVSVPMETERGKIIIYGPMIYSENAERTFSVTCVNGNIKSTEFTRDGQAWSATVHLEGVEGRVVLLRLTAQSSVPEGGDLRSLSIALGGIEFITDGDV